MQNMLTTLDQNRVVRCLTNKIILPTLFAGVLAIASPIANAGVDRVGNPFVPAGANFSLTALQGIDGSPLGGTGSPQVNRNFEFPDSIGVTFDQGAGHLKDFGVGLYADSAHQTQSTGLQVLFNQPIFASSATVTVEDFDIEASKDTFFKSTKVEPSIALLGPGNTVLSTALPADIFPNLVPVAGEKDVWNINFAGLLNTLHLADTPINGLVLFADQTAGERPSSDPYLVVAIGNGTVVPEPSTYLLLTVTGALAVLFHSQRRLLRRRVG
jgi:hypothetical protein